MVLTFSAAGRASVGSVALIVALVGCDSGTERVDRSSGSVGLSISQQPAAGETFSFEADVSIRTLAQRPKRQPDSQSSGLSDPSAAAQAPEESALNYHISYREHGPQVEVDISPPEVAANRTPSGPTIWSSLRKIHFASDSSVPQLTLLNGRVIYAGVGLFQRQGVGSIGVDSKSFASLTPVERARLLRGKIRPFLRLRSESKAERPDFARDSGGLSAKRLPQDWVAGNSDFDVLERRELAEVPSVGKPRARVTLELRAQKVAGTPSLLP
jgi:hypothetical protein